MVSDVLQAVSLFIFIIFIYLYNFFYNFYFYNFYLFLAVLVLRSCEGFSLVVVSGGSRCGDFSCCGAWALGHTGFNICGMYGRSGCSLLVLEHRLNSCGTRASSPRSMWDLPGSGIDCFILWICWKISDIHDCVSLRHIVEWFDLCLLWNDWQVLLTPDNSFFFFSQTLKFLFFIGI